MRALFAAELRALPRQWPLWTLPPLAAIAGWGMLPVNAELYRTHINFDPQGPDQTLDNYRIDVFAVYTSGLAWTQLLALFLGAYLVLRHPRMSAGPGPLLAVKAVVAALGGLLLAVIALATALPTAHSHVADHEALAILSQYGAAPDELGLADPSVWLVMVSAVATVALFGVLGAGLAALLGRWPLIWVLLGVLALDGLNFMFDSQVLDDYPVLPVVVVYYVLAIVAIPWIMLWYTLLSSWAPAVVVIMLILASGVVALGYLMARRRFARGSAQTQT